MKGKALPVALVAFGAVLIAAGLILRLVIVPALSQFPDDVNTTRTYNGVVTMLNREALEDQTQALFFESVSVVSDRTVKTEQVDGGKALVRDTANLVAAEGTAIAGKRLTGSDDFYTIDRKSMESIDNFADHASVLPREGLVIGFPIGTEQRDYAGWNGDPQLPVTLFYQGEEERQGVNTYVFTASSGPEPIKDPGTLAEFPAGVPRDAVPAILPLLNLSPELESAVGVLINILPEVIPLEYTYEFEATYWVEPATGVLIDINKHDIRKAIVRVPNIPLEVPPIEVYNLVYEPSPESLEDAVDDANSYRSLLQLGTTTGPFTLIGLAIASLIGGALLLWRRNQGDAPVSVTPPHHVGDPTPLGNGD